MNVEPDGSVENRTNPDGSRQDDWDEHWDRFGEAAQDNPANNYRHGLVLRLLGAVPPGSTLLDIGCGQGQFALDFKTGHPHVTVLGVEHSTAGVRRACAEAQRRRLNAQFLECDLLQPVTLDAGLPAASHAVCSEVLEHVADPATLLRNARALLAPGALVVITVPGGPRSAFDRHIGHFRHFTGAALQQVITDAGLRVESVYRAGFPFFNLYKVAVILRGEKLVQQMSVASDRSGPSRLERLAVSFFKRTFAWNLLNAPLGWQLAAVARVPEVDPEC